MTKKDYELIAKAFNACLLSIEDKTVNTKEAIILKKITWNNLRSELAFRLSLDNNKFNIDKFNNACKTFYKK